MAALGRGTEIAVLAGIRSGDIAHVETLQWSLYCHAMDWVYYIALVALLVTGIFVNLLGLPGLWLMLASAAVYG